MFLPRNIDIALIHFLRRKIQRDGKLCSKELTRDNTWAKFKRAAAEKKIVLYGAGEMFDYFCRTYLDEFNIAYAVDRTASQKRITRKRGISIYPIEKLTEEQEPYVVLITPIGGIDKIIVKLEELGIKEYYFLPAMEYQRISVWLTVHLWKSYAQSYQYKNYQLEKRIDLLQKQQTERYLYLRHTNQVLNALIDKTDDIELKKEQMRYHFMRIHKNPYNPSLDDPRTFNEKILHMTLYDHNPLYTEVTDKYLFKQYVAGKVGEKYVVPLLGVWDKPEEIDFSKLPNRFVLKLTGGGDGREVIIVKDKESLDIDAAIERMRLWDGKYRNIYYYNFNWPFKNIKYRIIAEEFLDIEGLTYKVYCFHGEPHHIHVMNEKPHGDTFFDINWNKLDIKFAQYPLINFEVPRPEQLDEMLDVSRKLSEPFQHVRVDFFVSNNKLYLSELTLATLGGLGLYEPADADYELGKLI